MPIHPDFQKILNNLIKQHGEEKGKQIYYAWLQKTGYDDTKPMAQQKTKKEAYNWTGNLTLQPKTTTIRGKALHPIKTLHPEEWPSVREYLEDELIRAARTLKDKPLLLDHSLPLRGSVVDAEYEDGAIEFVAQLDEPEVLDMIRRGEIKHCSVEFEWKTLEKMNGVAPRGIHFTGLSLLKSFEPGDPLTTVEVWEALVERLKKTKNTPKAVSEASKIPNEPPSPFSFQQASWTAGKEQAEPQEFILYTVRDPAAFLEERFSTAWIDMENGVQAIFGRLRENPENLQPQALLFSKAKGWTIEKMHDWLETHPQYLQQSASNTAVQQASQTGVSEFTEETGESFKHNWKEQEKAIKALNANFDALETRVTNLEKSIESMATQKLGEAIIPSEETENSGITDFISKKEILTLLPERIPRFWGYGPTRLVQRLKQKLQSPNDRE
mgnify:CR=1 FL=1